VRSYKRKRKQHRPSGCTQAASLHKKKGLPQRHPKRAWGLPDVPQAVGQVDVDGSLVSLQ
jgi:hypothetical protein